MKFTLKNPIRLTNKWIDTDGSESLSINQGYAQFSAEDMKKAGAINNSMLAILGCAALLLTMAAFLTA